MKCQNCGADIDRGFSFLSSSIENKGFDVKFQITKDGKPVEFCQDCVELIFFQWAKHVWDEGSAPENATNEELIDNLKRAIKIQTGLLSALENATIQNNNSHAETRRRGE